MEIIKPIQLFHVSDNGVCFDHDIHVTIQMSERHNDFIRFTPQKQSELEKCFDEHKTKSKKQVISRQQALEYLKMSEEEQDSTSRIFSQLQTSFDM